MRTFPAAASVFPAAARVAVLVLLALLACGEEPPKPVAPPEPELASPVRAPAPARRRGLWVLCEGSQRVLEHPERAAKLIADAQRLGTTDLFVQVYRGGRAWFDSTHADASPFLAMREASGGGDPLASLISEAQAAGMRVHAWVNVLSLAGRRDVPMITELGRGAVLVDRRGRSILDYPELDVPPPDRNYYRMGTPAVWLDPAVPAVVDRLARTFAELLERYPQLDGLHLDYIRYPGVLPMAPGSRFGVGLDFGYGVETRARFKQETGLEAPFGDSLANANRWDAWRRDQVRAVVRAIREAARTAHPTVLLSAAVGAYAERVYLAEGQDWRRWLEEGLLEFAVPMAYTVDDRLFSYMVDHFVGRPDADRVWIGLGTWLFAKNPERALDQIRVVRSSGATAEVLFSYDSIADAPQLLDALRAEAIDGG